VGLSLGRKKSEKKRLSKCVQNPLGWPWDGTCAIGKQAYTLMSRRMTSWTPPSHRRAGWLAVPTAAALHAQMAAALARERAGHVRFIIETALPGAPHQEALRREAALKDAAARDIVRESRPNAFAAAHARAVARRLANADAVGREAERRKEEAASRDIATVPSAFAEHARAVARERAGLCASCGMALPAAADDDDALGREAGKRKRDDSHE